LDNAFHPKIANHLRHSATNEFIFIRSVYLVYILIVSDRHYSSTCIIFNVEHGVVVASYPRGSGGFNPLRKSCTKQHLESVWIF